MASATSPSATIILPLRRAPSTAWPCGRTGPSPPGGPTAMASATSPPALSRPSRRATGTAWPSRPTAPSRHGAGISTASAAFPPAPSWEVAGGAYHSLALKTDGLLAAWGYNDAGQLGVPAGNDFVGIGTGNSHCLALRSAKKVSASVSGGHGSVDPAFQELAYGGTASIDLVPDAGYGVFSITDNGAEKAGHRRSTSSAALSGTIMSWRPSLPGRQLRPAEVLRQRHLRALERPARVELLNGAGGEVHPRGLRRHHRHQRSGGLLCPDNLRPRPHRGGYGRLERGSHQPRRSSGEP